jgi:hypothetical protein
MRPERPSIWTRHPELQAELEKMRGEGLSFGQIWHQFGRANGISRSALIGRSRRCGLEGPPAEPKPMKPAAVAQPKPRPPVPTNEPEAIGPVGAFPATGKCKFIAGDVASKHWRCCGYDATSVFSPWCEYHRRKVYAVVPRSARAA